MAQTVLSNSTSPQLNFRHLEYFWAVAHDGNLTRAAARWRVSQSALSAQIRQLEEGLGAKLFDRVGRRLELSEAGRLVLTFADDIFSTAHQLTASLHDGRGAETPLRVGAIATLSRNFQESFVAPLLQQPGARLKLESATLEVLLDRLEALELDLVLTNVAPRRRGPWRLHRLARQAISLVGRGKTKEPFRFPRDLDGQWVVLPGPESAIRAEFEAKCAAAGVTPRVLAEVDDMAMLRLLARDSHALALVPSVVVRDELRSGRLHQRCVVPGLFETFYAVSVARRFEHPRLRELLARTEGEVLEAP